MLACHLRCTFVCEYTGLQSGPPSGHHKQQGLAWAKIGFVVSLISVQQVLADSV
jgi:hypothetical protein